MNKIKLFALLITVIILSLCTGCSLFIPSHRVEYFNDFEVSHTNEIEHHGLDWHEDEATTVRISTEKQSLFFIALVMIFVLQRVVILIIILILKKNNKL